MANVVVSNTVINTSAQPSVRSWSTQLFDCCSDAETCCCAFWCFPCMQCKTTGDFGWCCCLPLLDVCCIVTCCLRSSMRQRYGITDSCCHECCTILWCYPCAWCQMSREVKIHKQSHAPAVVITNQVVSL